MKILLVNRWSQWETVGGAEKVFFSMANALSKKYEVVAFAMTQTGNGRPFFDVSSRVKFLHESHCYNDTKSIWHRIRRTLYVQRSRRHRSDQLFGDPVWGRKISPVIEQEKPDVVVAYSLDIARVLICTLSVRCPVVIMFHQSARLITEYLTPEDRETLSSAACIQVLMPSDVVVLKKRASCKNIICIPNAVNLSAISSTLMNHTIVHAGRFSRGDKRQHILIQALHLLHKKFPTWKIEFWGGTIRQNSYAYECYELAKKYQLEDYVEFKGITHDVPEELAKGSIFAFPSSEEGMGMALVEAMGVGLPAVGFRSCHAVNEIIQDGVNGILCEDSITAFAAGLKKLMESENLRKTLGRNAKESVSAYAPEKVWRAWENLLEQVVQDN